MLLPKEATRNRLIHAFFELSFHFSEIVAYLLDNKADLTAVTQVICSCDLILTMHAFFKDGMTAIRLADFHHHESTVRRLYLFLMNHNSIYILNKYKFSSKSG